MKRSNIILVILLVITITFTALITYRLTYVSEDVVMIKGFIGSFGWQADEDIKLYGPQRIGAGLYSTLSNERVGASNIFGLQLNLNENDKYSRMVETTVFNLTKEGLYSPLKCFIVLENHKIIAIAILCDEKNYYRDRWYYPINYTHQQILDDLKRQQRIGPFQDENS